MGVTHLLTHCRVAANLNHVDDDFDDDIDNDYDDYDDDINKNYIDDDSS